MAEARNGFERNLESTGQSREDKDTWEQYLERRNLVLQFLHSDLSHCNLQQHRNNAELLQKCYFYLEIEPKHVNVRDQNHMVHCTDILQLIDPVRLERMRKVGKNQAEIQLVLLTELLEHLEQGREELSRYVETWDMVTFLSSWELILQRMSELSQSVKNLHFLQMPGKLYVKHHLVLYTSARGVGVPNIRVSLYTKRPLLFDRNESVAYKDWASLKWFIDDQESHLEICELITNLLPNGSEPGYSRLQQVTSNTCIVRNLQPGSSYEFIITRAHTETLVLAKWHDSLRLKTQE